MTIRKMELLLDDDDFNTIQAEITTRQIRDRDRHGTMLPDGESSPAGAVLAECIRDLNEYRDLFEAERGNA